MGIVAARFDVLDDDGPLPLRLTLLAPEGGPFVVGKTYPVLVALPLPELMELGWPPYPVDVDAVPEDEP